VSFPTGENSSPGTTRFVYSHRLMTDSLPADDRAYRYCALWTTQRIKFRYKFQNVARHSTVMIIKFPLLMGQNEEISGGGFQSPIKE